MSLRFIQSLRNGHINARTVILCINPEVLNEILLCCDWSTLMDMAAVNSHARSVVQDIVKRRVGVVLRQFMSVKQVVKMWDLMELTQSMITGAIPWFVMQNHLSFDVAPKLLRIGVPKGAFQTWRNMAFEWGFTDMSGAPAEGGIGESIRQAKTFVQPKSDSPLRIVIVETTTHLATPAVLNSVITADMNIMDNSQLICMYPKLLRDKKAVEGFEKTSEIVGEWKERDVTVFRSTACWEKPCGTACPAISRLASQTKGMGQFEWSAGPSRDNRTQFFGYDPSKQMDFKWRIGKVCYNDNCTTERARKGRYA